MPDNDKNINLNFWLLAPEKESPDAVEYTKQREEIKNVFNSPPASFQPLELFDSTVNVYEKIEQRGLYFLGTLIRNQIYDVPPKYDEQKLELSRLPVEVGQGLGYQTSFLFDPRYQIVMIESTNNCVGISTFCALLKKNFNLSVDPRLVIDPAKMSAFNKMGVITKFKVKIASLQHGDLLRTHKRSAVGQIIHSADDTNTDTLEYTLSVGKRKSALNRERIRGLVRVFSKYDEEEIKTLIVTGKETDESDSNTIDFIQQKLRERITVDRPRINTTFNVDLHYTKLIEAYDRHPDLSVYKVKNS